MVKGSFDVQKTVMELIMTEDSTEKKRLAKEIHDAADKEGIRPSSIHEFYIARQGRIRWFHGSSDKLAEHDI